MDGVGLAFRENQKQAFLDSEPTWSQRLGEGWKGTRFLGKGNFGIVGLWEYRGDPVTAPPVTKVVVKQSTDEPMDEFNEVWGGKSAIDEGRILKLLGKLNSNHIIRQYGGNRLGDRFLDMGLVVRIFLEFCPGGDLDQLVAGFEQPPHPLLSELDLWRIFKCLALGISVLDRGTENINGPAWNGHPPDRPELCHFDIKPDNILLGYRDGAHRRFPILKIADFGEALWVAGKENQNDEYGSVVANRGNVQLSPPENTYRENRRGEQLGHAFQHFPIVHPRKGTCSNIWQIGAVMNILLKGQKLNFNNEGANPRSTLDRSLHNPRIGSSVNHSIGLDEPDCVNRYSRCLRELVKDCLLREPLTRPSSIQLIQRTAQGLRSALEAIRGLPPDPPDVIAARNIPLLAITNPDPPMEWTIDTSEFELDIRDVELLTPNLPTAETGNRGILSPLRNFGLPMINSILNSTASSTPGMPTPSAGASLMGSLYWVETPADDGDDFVEL